MQTLDKLHELANNLIDKYNEDRAVKKSKSLTRRFVDSLDKYIQIYLAYIQEHEYQDHPIHNLMENHVKKAVYFYRQNLLYIYYKMDNLDGYENKKDKAFKIFEFYYFGLLYMSDYAKFKINDYNELLDEPEHKQEFAMLHLSKQELREIQKYVNLKKSE